jgi:hypothetical protein
MSAIILDDYSLDTVLSFVRDAPARGCCKKWASHIYKAMMLEEKIRVQKRLHTAGSIAFDYISTRDLGPEITETIAFYIDFDPTGDYLLQFCHNVQDLADVCVDMTGVWRVEMGEILCETPEVPTVNMDGTVVGRAKAPVRFSLPVGLVLAGCGDPGSSPPLRWEHSVRSRSLLLDFTGEPRKREAKTPVNPADEAGDPDAPYVMVEGRRVQVHCDILATYPESSWADLMSVRVRVGLA